MYKCYIERIHGLDIYLVNVQTTRKIVQMFVAFSEELKFKILFEKREKMILLSLSRNII